MTTPLSSLLINPKRTNGSKGLSIRTAPQSADCGRDLIIEATHPNAKQGGAVLQSPRPKHDLTLLKKRKGKSLHVLSSTWKLFYSPGIPLLVHLWLPDVKYCSWINACRQKPGTISLHIITRRWLCFQLLGQNVWKHVRLGCRNEFWNSCGFTVPMNFFFTLTALPSQRNWRVIGK